ncbi:TIGR00266 family protein [Halospeciosus flavus]|uniref:TIGR00266 family protein n=1 Tax=Halospeciosus flavus TaxID=3032283 RepID=A0ABD5Z3Z2_9EURY|nr:TIGR00266 family protein [Halospeciosus flavus]
MEYDVSYGPSFAQLTVDLDEGESVDAEPGAMVATSEGIAMETGTAGSGGLLGAAKSALGGESFFVNTFRAEQPGHVKFAPPLPGDVVAHELADETLYLQSGAFLAAESDVEVSSGLGGATSFFGTESLVLLELSGRGHAFFGSYGAVDRVEIAAGETYTVDTGHVVAFDETVSFSTRSIERGLKGKLFGGEGWVCDFTGPGTVWLQTRDFEALTARLAAELPTGGN